MIGASVFSKLVTLSSELGVTNTDGTLRIYPNYVHMGDKQYPQVVYDVTNYTADVAMDGDAGTASCDVKILCVGQTYDDADALAQPVAAALDGTHGTWGSTQVQGCFLEEVTEDHFVDTDLETILYFVKELTYHVIIVT